MHSENNQLAIDATQLWIGYEREGWIDLIKRQRCLDSSMLGGILQEWRLVRRSPSSDASLSGKPLKVSFAEVVMDSRAPAHPHQGLDSRSCTVLIE